MLKTAQDLIDVERQIKEHPMCLKYARDKNSVRVYLPFNDTNLEAVEFTIEKGGAIAACRKLLVRLEEIWSFGRLS